MAAELPDEDSFVELARSILMYACEVSGNEDLDMLENLLVACEELLQLTIAMEDLLLGDISDFISSLIRLVRCVDSCIEDRFRTTNGNVGRGRPRIELEEEKLRFLIENGFKVQDIAIMLDCSLRTLERRLQELGITSRAYSRISDDEVDLIVSQIKHCSQSCGEKLVTGRLRSAGIVVPRERVRESLRRIDPNGITTRFRAVLHRRVYSVHSPNSLWHIDGYHKLIRWKIVIHGGIDGFSRLIVYLKVATNNRASTVLSAFQKAVQEYGLPSRVRMDKGGENILVSQYMVEQRGAGRNSAIMGRSVHNQRIERFWRDLFTGCISFFYHLFYFMEDINILNPDSHLDLFALHYVTISLLQGELDGFRSGWCQHSIRTEGNRTPLQLWTMGLCTMDESSSSCMVARGLVEVSALYCAD